MRFVAGLPQMAHLSPTGVWSKGILRVVTCSSCFNLSSHSRQPHHIPSAKAAAVDGGLDFFHVRHLYRVRFEMVKRLFVHIEIYVGENFAHAGGDDVNGHSKFFAGFVAAGIDDFAFFDVARTYFDADGHAFHLVFVEFPAGRVVGFVQFYAYAGVFETFVYFTRFFRNAGFVGGDGNNNRLDGRRRREAGTGRDCRRAPMMSAPIRRVGHAPTTSGRGICACRRCRDT